jgi:hypothetical protein
VVWGDFFESKGIKFRRHGRRLRLLIWAKDFCYNFFIPIIFLGTHYHNYLPYIFYSNIFTTILGGIAHNVPAVYDVFAAAIRERGAFQQPQNVGVGWRGNERSD